VLSLVEMYVHGVSTRKVKAVTEALCGLEISKSQVSRLAKDLDEEIKAWRSRPLKKAYPYVVVDARYEKIRANHQVISQGVLLVVGIGEDGYREILGTWIADSENESSWSEVFKELKERGLRGGTVCGIRRSCRACQGDREALSGSLVATLPGALLEEYYLSGKQEGQAGDHLDDPGDCGIPELRDCEEEDG
jgi:hypothetical protein